MLVHKLIKSSKQHSTSTIASSKFAGSELENKIEDRPLRCSL
jgi:hypothetical protein